MKAILLAIAATLIAAGNGLMQHANGTAPDETGTAPEGEKPKRGRPAGSTNKPAAEKPKEEDEAGETDEERYQRNLALIEPIVKGQKKGKEVAGVVQKYSKTGLKDLPADKQADFEADIEALSM